MTDSPSRVLVTRPLAQGDHFAAGCRALGLAPILLPCLSIEAVPVPAERAPRAGLAVFTSHNAVAHASRIGSWPWPGVRALALGPATARSLAQADLAVWRAPLPPFTSEAVLQLLDTLPTGALDDGVTVVTGEGGRRWLVDALRDGGHRVSVLETYRRVASAIDDAALRLALQPLPDIVTSTSDASLDALLAFAERLDLADALRHQPLIVNAERAATHARRRGFTGRIDVPAQAGDDGQLACLAAWRDADALPDDPQDCN